MESPLKIKLLARKSLKTRTGLVPIYIDVVYESQRSRFSSKVYVTASYWDKKSQRLIDGADKDEQNKKLDDIRHHLFQHYEDLKLSLESITAKKIVDLYLGKTVIMNTILRVFEKHNEDMYNLLGKTYAYGSFKNYKTTIKHLKKFIKFYYRLKDMPLVKVDSEFIHNFSDYLLNYTECKNNGMMKHMQRLKKVVLIALNKGYIKLNPYHGFNISFKRKPTTFLIDSELERLRTVSLNPQLSNLRDYYLFSCYTGLAFVDISNLRLDQYITKSNGSKWIRTYRQKTGEPSNIPLIPPAIEIIERHIAINKPSLSSNTEQEIHINKDALIFRIISNQAINRGLAKIAKESGIYKHITFHSARHTFATTITLSNGVPMETVSKMMGHANIKTTQRYAQVLDNKIENDMAHLMNKY